MANLVEIRNRDDQLCRITRDCHVQVAQALHGTLYETTAMVLSSLVAKLEALKKGILDLGEVDNLYSMYELFRVFLEHLLRVQAIFLVLVSLSMTKPPDAKRLCVLQISRLACSTRQSVGSCCLRHRPEGSSRRFMMRLTRN